MIKSIIVEDEFNAQNSLAKLIRYTHKDIQVMAMVDNVEDAISKIKEIEPQLVFLDIELSGGNAFQILEALESISFKIIFTTAYDEFAIKSIKFNTLDYLLKPIDSEELDSCLKKFKETYKQELAYKDAVQKLTQFDKKQQQQTLLIKTTDQQYILDIKDIIRCQADGSYTTFFTASGSNGIMSARNLKYYENLLSAHSFVRVHQSHLVNLQYIESINSRNVIRLTNGQEVPLATRKKTYIKQFLDKK